MKRSIILSVFALLICAVISAQSTDQNSAPASNRTKEQVKVQKETKTRNEAAAHGEAVSATAKNTDSGPGKGEVVSQEAKSKSKGEMNGERTRANNNTQGKNTGARPAKTKQKNVKPAPASGPGRK